MAPSALDRKSGIRRSIRGILREEEGCLRIAASHKKVAIETLNRLHLPNRTPDRVSQVLSIRPKAGNRPVKRTSRNSDNTLSDQADYLYEYARYVYREDIDRFARIDHKAAENLSVTVIVLGVVLSLGEWWVSTDLSTHIRMFFSVTSWVLVAFMLVAAGISIGYSIATLRVHSVPVPPLSDEVFDYTFRHDVVDSKAGAAATLKIAHDEVTTKIDRKGIRLARAYLFTTVFLSIVAALFVASVVRQAIT
jgi:hypothetical protein